MIPLLKDLLYIDLYVTQDKDTILTFCVKSIQEYADHCDHQSKLTSFISGKENVFVIEGNYLLDQSEPWSTSSKNYQLSIFVDLDDNVIRQRLSMRHIKSGYRISQLKEKIENVDMFNTIMIRNHHSYADVYFRDLENSQLMT